MSRSAQDERGRGEAQGRQAERGGGRGRRGQDHHPCPRGPEGDGDEGGTAQGAAVKRSTHTGGNSNLGASRSADENPFFFSCMGSCGSQGAASPTHLGVTRGWRGALLAAALGALIVLLQLSACAHAKPTLASVFLVDPQGVPLELEPGRVTVVEVCASWADACLFNVRAVSELCKLRCGDEVRAISVILDDPPGPAVDSYRGVFATTQELALPTPEAIAGESALGSLHEIPAFFIFDRSGRLVDEVRGGVVSAGRIITRVDALLGRG